MPSSPATSEPSMGAEGDPYLWLEELDGAAAVAWVTQRNAAALAELTADPRFEPLRRRFLSILDSKERIPGLSKVGGAFYNFWRDERSTRGLWRRLTSLDAYARPEPGWETVLDLDALAAAENEPWVWHGATPLYPRGERCLVQLSRGGADAVVVRELDTVARAFVPGGFTLPEAKSQVGYRDVDSLFVATDFGPGTLTSSGYPRQVKLWRRGQRLEDATLVFEGATGDVAVGAARSWIHGTPFDLVVRATSFYTSHTFLLDERGALTRIDVPDSATVDLFAGQLLVTLRDDWTVDGRRWPGGSLLAAPLAPFLHGVREVSALFTPSATTSLQGTAALRSSLILQSLEDVKTRATRWVRDDGRWRAAPLAIPVDAINFGLSPLEPTDADELWLTDTSFTRPTTLSVGPPEGPFVQLRQQPAFFDASGLEVSQHFATSRDGTRVPYFETRRRGASGPAPTVLTGYGGFEISLQPAYDGLVGAGWLERGGTLVVANIRGGGEYGPRWHQAALTHRRQNAYDDFIAVAEDLVRRGVTVPRQLGITGGSNGGLLVGVMLTQRPELFGAVVCQVPLLDMKRYSQLLAGASWVAEYGDPSREEDWGWLSAYSPYHRVQAGVAYPRTLLVTSTRDDRVHPGHARKMAARMIDQGHQVLLFENLEGGHGGAADNPQTALMKALVYTFLSRQLGL